MKLLYLHQIYNVGGSIMEFSGEEKDLNKLLEFFKKGDPRCRYQPGDRVIKVQKLEPNELSELGTQGKVIGCIFIPDAPGEGIDKECYMIVWDGFPAVVMTVGRRIGSLKDVTRYN